MCITCAAYWTGLYGPFILDDVPNLLVVREWLSGNASLHQVLSPPGPWIDKRSISMSSFALTAALGGYDPFAFKLGNLILHLGCGALLYAILLRLLRRDPQLHERAALASAAITAVWLLHPLHASTVLYAVQRMAQLGALSCLLAIWLYVLARERMERGEGRLATALLFVGLPLIFLVGIQAKPNAAVMPLLLLVVELAYYRHAGKWPRKIAAFFLLFVALPIMAGFIGHLIRPDALLGRYAEYDFSAGERLLSQPRVLFAYLVQLLAPNPPSMGVFTDGYPASRGLLSPPTTLAALIALLLVSALAWGLRSRARGFLFGWCFFLAAHFIESAVAPVELYYEHRNYLPSVGIFVATASLLVAGAHLLASRGVRTGRIAIVSAFAAFLVLAVQTHGRARIWGDPLLLVKSEREAHPKSVRALVNYISVAQTVGDLDRAYAVTEEVLAHSDNTRLKKHALLLRVWLDCINNRSASMQDVHSAIEMSSHLDLQMYMELDWLSAEVEKGHCGQLDRKAMAWSLQRVADRARRQPDTLNLKWAIRNRAAQFYAEAGEWELALSQARLGWQKTTPGRGAAMLIEIFLVAGKASEAKRIYREARARIPDASARRDLDAILPLIEAELDSPGWNKRRASPGSFGPRSPVGAQDLGRENRLLQDLH
jgi:hypothetical protein